MGRDRGGAMLRRYDTFIFDWDGTLSKSVRIMTQKIDPYWKYKQAKYSNARDGKRLSKGRLEATVVRRYGSSEIERGILTKLADISLLFIRPRLYDDVKPVLLSLRKRRKKVALLTNGASYRVLRELRYLGIRDLFDVIISAQDIKALKPNTAGLEAALVALKAKRSRALYVGDTVDDVVMAKRANVSSCAVSEGLDRKELLEAAHPDYLFGNVAELKRAIFQPGRQGR
jgi:phosphoglycolate phosphatase